MPKTPMFRGRAVEAMSEAEAKRALKELVDPPRAVARRIVRPKVRRPGLSPSAGGATGEIDEGSK